MEPIEILQKELTELQRSLAKSHELYGKGKLTWEVHKTHLQNLFPKIQQFENAIKKLLE